MGILSNIFGGGDDASDAIKKSNEIYQQYAQQAMKEMKQMYAQGRTDITGYAQPYTAAGQTGLQAYLASLGLGGAGAQQTAADRFRASPGYQFALRQGIGALQAGGAARGMTGSGAAAMALQRYGQGMAQQEYGRYQAQLAGLAGMGQQTAMSTGISLADLGRGYAGSIAGLYGGMGQAAAGSELAEARAKAAERGGLFGEIGGLAGTAIGAYYGGPQGAMMGGQLGGGLGKMVGGGQGWQTLGGQQPQQQQQAGGGFAGLSSLGGIFGQSYNPSQGTAATSLWGSNVWMNPDTGQLVPIK